MASEHPRERELLEPLREGTFRQISGIGPGIEQRLHAAGIETFDHLASLTPEEICVLLKGLVGITVERVTQQDWTGQARKFAQDLRDAAGSPVEEDPAERQHYSSFMVELLQDDEHSVRRTRVVHVQGGHKESWAGWEPGRLIQWIIEQGSIPNVAPSPNPEPEPAGHRKPDRFVEMDSVEIFDPSQQGASRFFFSEQPFELRLRLNLEKAGLLPTLPLNYQVLLSARPIGSSEQILLSETKGICPEGPMVTLSAPAPGLAEGTYHLEATTLIEPEEAGGQKIGRLKAISEGGIVHVFTATGKL